jgi:hypothetical protein
MRAIVSRGAYIRELNEDRARTLDEFMKTCGSADDGLLETKAGSRSAIYGLKSSIETLVWLHCCLDGYSCLLCSECLRNSWYGCCDVVCVG